MNTGWVDDALRMPIAFAQVREDPRVDLAVAERLGRSDLSGLTIASGGCTAAALAASGQFAELHLVDANAAQLALTRLKLHLLTDETPARRLQLLGHAPLATRGRELTSILNLLTLPPDALGPADTVAEVGPDFAGRYESLFARLRAVMQADAMLDWSVILPNPGAAEAVAPGTALGLGMDEAFDAVMTLDVLVALFGRAATQNSVEPFSRHFASRARHALATLPTASNPFLWQMLVGRFPAGRSYDWLPLPAPAHLPEITSAHATMRDVLEATPPRRYDFIHLSNILDWLSVPEALEMLHHTHRALKPGGLTIIRQLNSTLDLPALGPQFEWLTDEADALHARDRSFFYRRLHLGRRA